MFFETFVGPEDNWLPPDNCQQQPVAVVAHRTSPTNMGLTLLANLAAYDFGYVTAGELVERTGNTLRTMSSLDRHQGHFYNWYDTQSLQPLMPHYVSSVDSGNLAGHLLTLRAGLSELRDEKIIGLRLFEGLSDTLWVLAGIDGGPDPARLAQLRKDLDSAYDSRPATIDAMLALGGPAGELRSADIRDGRRRGRCACDKRCRTLGRCVRPPMPGGAG